MDSVKLKSGVEEHVLVVLVEPAADPKQVLLLVVLNPGEFHVGQGIGLLLAGRLVGTGQVELHPRALLVVEQRD
jgi:hypothetical protein